MLKTLLAAIGSLILVGCVNHGPVFERMSTEEIAAYNETVPFHENVVCVREIRAGTHIKKRYCETFEEMHTRFLDSIGKLNTTNAGGASVFTTH